MRMYQSIDCSILEMTKSLMTRPKKTYRYILGEKDRGYYKYEVLDKNTGNYYQIYTDRMGIAKFEAYNIGGINGSNQIRDCKKYNMDCSESAMRRRLKRLIRHEEEII